MTPICVLRSGGDFRPEHVQWLARQVPRLVCLSDMEVPGVPTFPLAHSWPKWWAKMEAFDPAIEGDILLVDLDTVVLKLPETPTETTVLRDFYAPDSMGSGFMFVTAQDRARVWEAWIADPEGHMARNQRWPHAWGDQGFLRPLLGDCQKWQDIAKVYSYKVHCANGVPADAQVVCFHGKPRPWQARGGWIPPLFPQPERKDFRELILAHKGRRFIIMGGGPSLAADLDALGRKPGDVVISCNAHGVELRTPDYLLAMDSKHTKSNADMGVYLRKRSDAPIISPHAFADYRLGYWPQHPRFVLSGLISTWAAYAMGAKVVCLAGMDGYKDNDYTEEARKIAREVRCPVRVQPESFLRSVWGVYDAKERFGRYTPHSAIDGLRGIDGRVRVRASKPCAVGFVSLQKGDEVSCMRHEVRLLLKHRMVEEV